VAQPEKTEPLPVCLDADVLIAGLLSRTGASHAIPTSMKDLAALPGNRFEALSGDRKGQYSIRIDDQWRICFEWPGGSVGPVNVEIVDYH